MSHTTTAPAILRSPILAVATVVVGIGCTALGAHDWREMLVVAGAIVVAGAVAFGLVVPRARRTGTQGPWALGLGIPAAALLLPAFWSGLPLVLGVAAVALGNEGRLGQRGSGRAITGLVLGAVAVVGYLAIYVSEGFIADGRGFLFD